MSMTAPTSRAAVAAAVSGWFLAAALLVHVAISGPVDAPGLVFDRLTATLTVVVIGVAAITAAFSTRYLQDDPRLGRFLGMLGLTTVGTVAFTAAATVPVLVGGWVLASAGFCGLLAHRSDVAGGKAALRRTAAAFAVGDAALVGAGAIVLAAAGSVSLAAPGDTAARLDAAGVGGVVSVLIVIAALARCGQLPLHRWLPSTVAAPTPVSALLHAGLVNAGGILLVKTGPVFGLGSAALALLFTAGAATAAYGTAVMLTRTDVKGALAHSTMAQMGFMLVQVALGAASAAIVHLVGHAMYKAALFLGSGSAVGARRRRSAAPHGDPLPAPVRRTAAIGLPALALGAALVIAGGADAVGGTSAAVLIAFAWASAAHGVDGWLRSGPPRGLAVAAGATAAAALAYVGLLGLAKEFLDPALPAAPAVPAWVVAPIVAAVVLMTIARIAVPATTRVWATAYAWLVDAGSVAVAAGPPGRRGRRSAPVASVPRIARVTS